MRRELRRRCDDDAAAPSSIRNNDLAMIVLNPDDISPRDIIDVNRISRGLYIKTFYIFVVLITRGIFEYRVKALINRTLLLEKQNSFNKQLNRS